jgi:hypothetical protein
VTHAVGAALYALKAVHDASNSDDDAVAKEREWQRSRLQDLLRQDREVDLAKGHAFDTTSNLAGAG